MTQQQGWADLYRPTTLDDMALDPEVRERFKYYLSSGLPQSLILHGPPGFGKSTIAKIIANELYGGIDSMRVARYPKRASPSF